jgi:hypothetical protein
MNQDSVDICTGFFLYCGSQAPSVSIWNVEQRPWVPTN